MKVIVAGSRSISQVKHTLEAIEASGFAREATEFVSGAATGPDTHAMECASRLGLPVKLFLPRWRDRDGAYNPRAGYERNIRMAEYADALIAVWDGESGGTRHMIEQARKRGLKVYIHTVTL